MDRCPSIRGQITITDEDNPNTTDATDDGDKPTINIAATDATAIEGAAGDVLVYEVSQTNPSNFDTVAHVSLSGAVSAADVASISYTDANGVVQTVTDPAAIQALFTNGFDVKIPAGATSAPAITITPAQDDIYEVSEALTLTISSPSRE